MLLVKVNDGVPDDKDIITEKTFRARVKGTVFPTPLKKEWVTKYGYAMLESSRTDLVQTFDTRLTFRVVKEGDVYKREWYLKKLGETEANKRKTKKLKEIRAERDKLLAASDYTQGNDYYDRKEEWLAYRAELRDISEQNDDPFLIRIPKAPGSKPANDLRTKQTTLINNVNKVYNAYLTSLVVDTGLGYQVNGDNDSLETYTGGQELGMSFVFDSEGNKKTIDDAQWTTLIKAVKQKRLAALEYKLVKTAAIKACKTFDELTVIETTGFKIL